MTNTAIHYWYNIYYRAKFVYFFVGEFKFWMWITLSLARGEGKTRRHVRNQFRLQIGAPILWAARCRMQETRRNDGRRQWHPFRIRTEYSDKVSLRAATRSSLNACAYTLSGSCGFSIAGTNIIHKAKANSILLPLPATSNNATRLDGSGESLAW